MQYLNQQQKHSLTKSIYSSWDGIRCSGMVHPLALAAEAERRQTQDIVHHDNVYVQLPHSSLTYSPLSYDARKDYQSHWVPFLLHLMVERWIKPKSIRNLLFCHFIFCIAGFPPYSLDRLICSLKVCYKIYQKGWRLKKAPRSFPRVVRNLQGVRKINTYRFRDNCVSFFRT